MDIRDGTQTGHWQYAASNNAPSAASRSMFGVRTRGWPVQPKKSHRCWSDIRNRMLGFLADLAWFVELCKTPEMPNAAAAPAPNPAINRRLVISLLLCPLLFILFTPGCPRYPYICLYIIRLYDNAVTFTSRIMAFSAVAI